MTVTAERMENIGGRIVFSNGATVVRSFASDAVVGVEVASDKPIYYPAGNVADEVVQAVAELPDRSSPEDWPEAMLVTSQELRDIVEQAVASALE